MYKDINEELKQYKLFKIKETETKLGRFKEVYIEIKEHIVIKFSKNATSNMVRIVLGTLSLLFFVLGLCCFFPNEIIDSIESNNVVFSELNKKGITIFLSLSKFILLGLSILLAVLGYSLRLNNRKRNSIYSLSKLLEEVMGYMEVSANDEKRKYEYFIDSLAEKEKIEREKVSQQQV